MYFLLFLFNLTNVTLKIHFAYRKRSTKISQQQQLFIEEMRGNEMLRNNKFDPSHPNGIPDAWKSLAQKLNSSGGPIKSVEAWKKVSLYFYIQYVTISNTFELITGIC